MSDAANDAVESNAVEVDSPHDKGVKSPSKVKSPAKSPSMKKPAASGALMKEPAASKAVAKPKPMPKAVPQLKAVIKSSMKKPASKQGNQTTQQKGGKIATSDWSHGLVTEKRKSRQRRQKRARTRKKDVKRKQRPRMNVLSTLNRSKSNKFIKMLQAGQLPQWLVDEYQKLMALKVGKREKVRDLINLALDHKGGKLILSTDEPYFHIIQRTFEESKSKEVEKSLPKRLLMGKLNLPQGEFDAALAEGDLVEVTTKKGKVQYMWGSCTHVNVEGKKQESGLSMEKLVSKKQKAMLEVAQQSWSIGLFVPTGDSSGSGGAQQGNRLAIKDRHQPLSADQWIQAKAQLKLAMDAFESMCQKGLKFLSNISHNKEAPLYGQLCLVSRKYLGMYLWCLCKKRGIISYHLDVSHVNQTTRSITIILCCNTYSKEAK